MKRGSSVGELWGMWESIWGREPWCSVYALYRSSVSSSDPARASVSVTRKKERQAHPGTAPCPHPTSSYPRVGTWRKSTRPMTPWPRHRRTSLRSRSCVPSRRTYPPISRAHHGRKGDPPFPPTLVGENGIRKPNPLEQPLHLPTFLGGLGGMFIRMVPQCGAAVRGADVCGGGCWIGVGSGWREEERGV